MLLPPAVGLNRRLDVVGAITPVGITAGLIGVLALHGSEIVLKIILVGEAALRCLLAVTLPTGTFLAAAGVGGWAVTGALMSWTVTYIRRSRRGAADRPDAALPVG